MKMNKVLAAMAASVVAASAFAATALSAGAAAETYPESFTVMLAGQAGGLNLGWDDASAKDSNSVKVDKNGTYTIKVDASEGGDQGESTWAMAIRSVGFNIFDYGEEGQDFAAVASAAGLDVKIDSVKIGGEEKLNGTASQFIANDDGNNFRVNIYNKWGNDYAIVDATQSFTGDIEVTFTVSGFKFGDQTAETTTAAAETTTAAAGETTTTTTAATTTTGKAGTTTTKAKTGEAGAKAGDAGVAVAVAALGLAAATAFAVRKKD